MALEFAGLTDVGRKRDHNEDALLLAPSLDLAVVADGMGGHNAGEVASNIAITALESFFKRIAADPDATWPYRFDLRFDECGNRLCTGIQFANRKILEAGAKDAGRRGMGTTCVGIHVAGSRAYFGWVGDSRGYLFRKGRLEPVTSDHSLVNELLRTGRLAPADVASFQHKNVITRALGQGKDVTVDVETRLVEPGDILVACCDGLTGMLEDDRIGQILDREHELDRACQRLIDASNAAGGLDNITVALVRVS